MRCRTVCALLPLVLFLLASLVATAQQPGQQAGPDPIAENVFPPELIMQNQQAIGLSEEQKNFLKAETRKAQTRFTELQWQLQDEVEALVTLLKQDRPNEQQVLGQLDKVLNAERDVKRAQFSLLLRFKNNLTPEQQAKLREMRKSR
jgi:Spy/CpxP family protein refolding chaperone